MVAVGLGAAVHGEVLRGRDHLQVAGVVSLQALHELDAHARGEVRILAVGFLAAPPSRVAEDVDVRRPEGQALIAAALAPADELVVLGARLVADRGGHLAHQRLVERRGHADRLGKHRRRARPGHAVQALVPPLVGRDAQARDGRCSVHELRDLLFHRHPRHEVAKQSKDR